MVNCNYKIIFALTYIICIHVAAAAEVVVYEVVAEPPEPLEQAQQEVRCENPAQGPVHPSTQQQPEGKPWCMPYYFKFMTPIYVSITCALGLGIVWNSSA